MLGAEDWLADPRFKDDLGRGKHAHVVSERLRAWCSARTRAEALKAFETARVPAGPVHSPQEALDDAHIRASGILREIAYPGAPRPAPVVDTPIRLSETPGAIRGRAPMLGEHAAEILGKSAIRWRRSRVCATPASSEGTAQTRAVTICCTMLHNMLTVSLQ